MAADTFTLPNYNEPAVYSRNTQSAISRSVTFALADITGAAGSAADPIETSDVIKLFKLPPDVKILGGKFHSGALDSGSALILDLVVSDGTTTKYIFDGMTACRAGGAVNSDDASATGFMHAFSTASAIGYVIPGDNWYVAILGSTGATGAGAADDIFVQVEYTTLLESNEATFRT